MASGPGDIVKEGFLSDTQSGWGHWLGLAVRPGYCWRSAGRESWSFILGSFYTWCSVQMFTDEPDRVCGSRGGWGWPVSGDMRMYTETHGHLRNSLPQQPPPQAAPTHNSPPPITPAHQQPHLSTAPTTNSSHPQQASPINCSHHQ